MVRSGSRLRAHGICPWLHWMACGVSKRRSVRVVCMPVVVESEVVQIKKRCGISARPASRAWGAGHTGRTSATRLDGTRTSPSIDRCGRSADQSLSRGSLFVRPLRFRHVPTLTYRKHEESCTVLLKIIQPHVRYCGKASRDTVPNFIRICQVSWMIRLQDFGFRFAKTRYWDSHKTRRRGFTQDIGNEVPV